MSCDGALSRVCWGRAHLFGIHHRTVHPTSSGHSRPSTKQVSVINHIIMTTSPPSPSHLEPSPSCPLHHLRCTAHHRQCLMMASQVCRHHIHSNSNRSGSQIPKTSIAFKRTTTKVKPNTEIIKEMLKTVTVKPPNPQPQPQPQSPSQSQPQPQNESCTMQ